MTMFLALVKDKGPRVRYVNAGHVPPVVVRAGGPCEWLETGGMVVGLLPEVQYERDEIALQEGDVLVACTDGITEAMDAAGNEFGRPRLAESVMEMKTTAY